MTVTNYMFESRTTSMTETVYHSVMYESAYHSVIYVWQSRTTYVSHELHVWVTNYTYVRLYIIVWYMYDSAWDCMSWCESQTTYVSLELHIWVTNYICVSRIYVWHETVCHSVMWVTNYIYESRITHVCHECMYDTRLYVIVWCMYDSAWDCMP